MKYRYQEIPCAQSRRQYAICDDIGRPILRTVDYHVGSEEDAWVSEFLKRACDALNKE